MNRYEELLKRLTSFKQSEKYKSWENNDELSEDDKEMKRAIKFLENDDWSLKNKKYKYEVDKELILQDRNLQLKKISYYLDKYDWK